MPLSCLRRFAAMAFVALVFGLPSAARADSGIAACASLFAANGAVQGTASCYWTAYGSPTNLSNYYCITNAMIRGYCANAPKLVGVFNGVWNTKKDADALKNRVKRELGTSYRLAPVNYDVFYNHTGCKTPRTVDTSCLEDIAETFAQRTAAVDTALAKRWEVFWELISGTYPGADSFTTKLTVSLAALVNLRPMMSDLLTAFVNTLVSSTTSLIANPPTADDMATHLAQLHKWFGSSGADQVDGAMLVAHSQGNLFANAAYDAFKAQAPAAKLSVVHVAPASPTLRGGYALADIDVVINGLRLTGTKVPANNLTLPTSDADPSGHQFQATYLDTTRPGYAAVRQLMTTALDSLY